MDQAQRLKNLDAELGNNWSPVPFTERTYRFGSFFVKLAGVKLWVLQRPDRSHPQPYDSLDDLIAELENLGLPYAARKTQTKDHCTCLKSVVVSTKL